MTIKRVDNSLFFSLVEEELAKVGSVRISVRGDSMRPLLRDGIDEVCLRKLDAEEPLLKGEIYLFRCHDRYVLHRCIKEESTHFFFRGDNAYNTEVCHRDDVRAVVEQVYRKKSDADYRETDHNSSYWRLRRTVARLLRYLKKLHR